MKRRTLLGSALALPAILRAGAYPEWKMIGPWGGSARTVRLDPANPSKMMALTMRGAGVFRTEDAGESWHEAMGFPLLREARLDCGAILRPGNVPLWLAGASPGGLWLSEDEGVTWRQSSGTAAIDVYAVSAWDRDNQVVAIGTNQGVWLSHDAARTWRRVSSPKNPDMAAIVSVAFDPRKAGTIYAGTPHLPWKTVDGGAKWKQIPVGMYDDSDIFSIAVDPLVPGRVFASACSGIYCSRNEGTEWRRVQGIPGTNRRTYVVAQDPHQPERLYAGTSAGMWQSLDGGVKWAKKNDFVATSLAFHPSEAGRFYISTERHGIQMTSDAGETFAAKEIGFVSRTLSHIESDDVSWLAAGEYEGRFQKTAEGWTRARSIHEMPPAVAAPVTPVVPAPEKAYQSAVDPFDPRHILAATPRGLERSLDRGESWRLVYGGLGDGWIRSVTFDSKHKDRAFALRGQRVFWTRNGGTQWYWLPAREDGRVVFRSLQMAAADPTKLLAISDDRGLFSYDLQQNPLD